MNSLKLIIASSIFIVAFVAAGAWANGMSEVELPRTYGPTRLGMTVEQFKENTKVEPTHCATCAEKEIQALLSPDQTPGAKLAYQSPAVKPEQVNYFFYKGRLYGIVFLEVSATYKSFRESYGKVFGEPKAVENWKSGLSQARWEDSSTILTLTYTTHEKGMDSLRVDYIDKRLAAEVPDFFDEN